MAKQNQTPMETLQYDNYEFYNPNPMYKETPKSREKIWKRGDCVVRALCCATDMRWSDVYQKIFLLALEVYDLPDSKIGMDHVLNHMGFARLSFGKVKKGQKRPKVHEIAEKFKDKICILDCGGHVLCTKHGCYYDTFDSGFMTVYSMYIKRV